MRIRAIWIIVIIALISAISGCGGGGSGSGNSANSSGDPNPIPSSNEKIISGIASKGIFKKNGLIEIYSLPTDGSSRLLLATALVDDNGKYSANIGTYAGSILVQASGDYIDEATGFTLTISKASPLRAAVADVVGNTTVSATALTELAVQVAGPTKLTANNIRYANNLISKQFGFDIIASQPVAADATALINAKTLAQLDYTLSLATISQMATNSTLSGIISALSADLSQNTTLISSKTTYDAAYSTYLVNHADIKTLITFNNVVDIATGDGLGYGHGVALKNDGSLNNDGTLKKIGTVWTWGWNSGGQLGDGTTTDRYTPRLVPGISKVIAIEAAWGVTYALKEDGTVWAWGMNDWGQLGDGTTNRHYTPAQVPGLTNITAISATGTCVLALQKNPATGTTAVWGWGNTYFGDGLARTQHNSPMQVPGLTQVKAIVAGDDHNLVLKDDGTVWTWGDNSSYQLGDGTTTVHYTPIQVFTYINGVKDQALSGITAIAAATGGANGYSSAFVLKGDGTVLAWGRNQCLGTGSIYGYTPTAVQGLNGVVIKSISAGNGNIAAIDDTGALWTWGDNRSGQLGNGNTTDSWVPIQVTGLTSVIAVSSKGMKYSKGGFSAAVTSDYKVWTWGGNTSGQLGNGTTTANYTPGRIIQN